MTTKLQQQLEMFQSKKTYIEQQITALEAKLTELAAAQPADSLAVKQLAVGLHTIICQLQHGGPNAACKWFEAENPDDATLVNWNDPEHKTWLERARSGIANMRTLGFTVTEPAEPEPG
jgi:hypothetical protein